MDVISPQRKTLGTKIRHALLVSADNKLKFLPKDELDNITSDESINEELGRLRSTGDWHNNGHDALGGTHSDESNLIEKIRPRKRLFAILSLVDRAQDILGFINEGVDDSNLPFVIIRPEGEGKLYGRDTASKDKDKTVLIQTAINSQWPDLLMESFEHQQWRICVPVFIREGDDPTKPSYFPLGHLVTLPFVEYENIGQGGSSAVRRARIPSSHHGFHDASRNKNRTSYFAVKKLDNSLEGDFAIEADGLSRFASANHRHLIQLLWTFSYRDHYHLVFPCADGNLADLMRTVNPRCGQKSAVWLAQQCLGVTEGLAMIHGTLNPKKGGGSHGRHGDLKPENFLWFKDDNAPDDPRALNGVLKISDFGLARFHGTNSKSRRASEVGYTVTQKAPEYDVLHKISPKYDIWSLGCVLLDLVTWYLEGCKAFDDFSFQRLKDDERYPKVTGVSEDTFFYYDQIKQPFPKAMLKRSVVEKIESLYDNMNTSDFTVELLNFIREHLLRMNPDKRASCTEIQEAFQCICKRCEESEDSYSQESQGKKSSPGNSHQRRSSHPSSSPATQGQGQIVEDANESGSPLEPQQSGATVVGETTGQRQTAAPNSDAGSATTKIGGSNISPGAQQFSNIPQISETTESRAKTDDTDEPLVGPPSHGQAGDDHGGRMGEDQHGLLQGGGETAGVKDPSCFSLGCFRKLFARLRFKVQHEEQSKRNSTTLDLSG